jgi:hypothetical protein
MAHLRDRKRRGVVRVELEIARPGVERLSACGWLRPEKQHDRQAVAQAVLDCASAALWPEESDL